MGDKKADLVLKNCTLLSVYTREIIPKIQIAISKDRIAYVGPDDTHTLGSKTKVIDVKNK
jgi:adenine deaminase